MCRESEKMNVNKDGLRIRSAESFEAEDLLIIGKTN